MQDESLVETWRRSVLEIKSFGKWITLWDGQTYYPDAVPEEVRGQDLYVVTAYNPGSTPLSDRQNRERDERLFAHISSLNSAGSFVSVGRSLSGSHTEYGYAIYGISKSDADNLATEFGQIGYYRLTSRDMEIFALGDSGEFSKV